MKPTQISADDTVGLYLSPSEKKMLLRLDELGDDIKDTIRQGSANRRKFHFTLGRITAVETAVSNAIQEEVVKNERTKWNRLDSKLIKIQRNYTCDDDKNALLRAVSGQPASKGAAVRALLVKMVEERKRRKKAKRAATR